jgi:hypothetical protein
MLIAVATDSVANLASANAMDVRQRLAVPVICGDVTNEVNVGRKWNLVERSISNPQLRMSFSVSLVSVQPPTILDQNGSIHRCSRRVPAAVAATCSKNRSCPPGRSTRCTCVSARSGEGTEHSTRLQTTASIDSSGKGRRSTSPLTNDTLAKQSLTRLDACVRRYGSGSSATTCHTSAG